MKRLLFVLLTATCSLSFSQSRQTIDSLKNQLHKSKLDTSRVWVLIQLGEAFSGYPQTRKLGSADFYANQALELSQKINNRKWEAQAFSVLGNIKNHSGSYLASIENYQKSLRIDEELKDTIGIVDNLFGSASIYSLKKELRKGGRQKGLSAEAEKNARLAEMYYKEGILGVNLIAQKLSISKVTFYKYLRHRGVQIHSKRIVSERSNG